MTGDLNAGEQDRIEALIGPEADDALLTPMQTLALGVVIGVPIGIAITLGFFAWLFLG